MKTLRKAPAFVLYFCCYSSQLVAALRLQQKRPLRQIIPTPPQRKRLRPLKRPLQLSIKTGRSQTPNRQLTCSFKIMASIRL